MKHVILAEPGVFALFGLAFMLMLATLVVLGVVGIVALVLRRNEKPDAPPVIPPTPSTIIVPQKCPKCGAPMPTDAPEGLCPRCLIALNLATQTDIPGEMATAKAPPGPPLPASDIAKLFPQLEILECLGRGGMGAVYKARQPRLDRIVALKILSPEKQSNQKFAERFEREARALAKLHHPNIVTVYDFGETQGNYYLLMEFVDGLTLRQLLQTRKLEPAEALAIVPKICEALQYAHGLGIVHRDIKPENVLMDKEGRVKIADFGIAKILGDGERTNLTEEQAIGTPHYMSPEQIERPQTVDHRADIYSLGVVFYEMLTGELPLGKFQPPSKKVQVDVRLDEIVLRALEKEPERRYQQASEVKTRLETIAATAPYAGAPGQPHIKPDHFWRWFAVICLSLIVLPILILIIVSLVANFIPAFMRGRQEADLHPIEFPYSAGQGWFPLGDDIEISSFVLNGTHVTVKGHYNLASHTDALLKLGVTSDRIYGSPDEQAQCMYINGGSGEFTLTTTRNSSGFPHISMYADGRPFATLYFGRTDEVAQEKQLYDSMMSDPVALWLANGSANDSAHGHDGLPVNVSYTSGVVGSAFVFHPESNPGGAYSGIKIHDDPAFAVTNAFSIEGWIRPTGLGYVIFWRGDNRPGTDPYSLSMEGTTLKFTICDEADNDAEARAQIAYNEWWHIAAVYDHGTLTLYTNGVVAAETNSIIRPFGRLLELESPGLGIGNLNDGGNNFPFRGDIDDLAFYSRPLSPLEVRFNYEVGFKSAAAEASPNGPPTVVTGASPAPTTSEYSDLQKTMTMAEAQIIKDRIQIAQLSKMNNAQLRQALPDITKDSALNRLLQDLDNAEQESVMLNTFHGSNSPDRVSLNARTDEINQQINDRILGLMVGLKDQLSAQEAALDSLQAALATNGNPETVRITANQLTYDTRNQTLTASGNVQIQRDRSQELLLLQPPVVVETFPVSGARDVAPGDTEIRVRFSKAMMDQTWSWSTAWDNSTPESIGAPHYLDDGRTCVMKVHLEPGKTYAWWLNSDKFHNFKDAAGQAAVPYLLIFQTKPTNPK
jgi:serine/threonine protein kinase